MADIDDNMVSSQLELQQQPQYRPAKSLPYELREHCIIYLEEGLYTQALVLLANMLTAGQSLPHITPAFVPTPQLLAVIATITVHPKFSNQSDSTESIVASNQALDFLQHVLNIVGPVNAQIANAFTFTEQNRLRKQHQKSQPIEQQPGDVYYVSSGEDEDFMDSAIAQKESIWERADDFWHIVGWAFNCSVNHPNRWARWKIWLEFMLDAIEADIEERLRLGKAAPNRLEPLKQSLAMRYLSKAGGRHGRGERWRIVRAICAHGTKVNCGEFREVFRNETKALRKKQIDIRSPRKRVNLDEGDFGDYYDDDEDDDDVEIKIEKSDQHKPRHSTRGRNPRRVSGLGDVSAQDTEDGLRDSIEAYGGPDAIVLRRRCMLLLMHIAAELPEDFVVIDEIYDLVAEEIKGLPLAVFGSFVLPTVQHPFPPHMHSSLLKMLLIPLLARKPTKFDNSLVTQKVLEQDYLPFAAARSSVAENAKVSLVLETLMRLLRNHGMLQPTGDLRRAVVIGIDTRYAKANKLDVISTEEMEGEKWLSWSASRLQMIVEGLDDDVVVL